MRTTEKIAIIFWLMVAGVGFLVYALLADWIYRHTDYLQDIVISVLFLGFFVWLDRKLH